VRGLRYSSAMLVFSLLLGPEVILGGGWRAWAAGLGCAFVLWQFVDDLRATVRRRRIARQAQRRHPGTRAPRV
jgi:hypothetical protein